MNKRTENNIMLLIGIFLLSMIIILGAYGHYEKVKQEQSQPKVGVQSVFGCLTLDSTPEQFEAKQQFREDVFGYKLKRCK